MTKQNPKKTSTEAFCHEAVRLADQSGRNATQVAEELGIHVGQIYNWRTQFNKLSRDQFTVADGTYYAKAASEEVRRLNKRITELELERDFSE